MGSFAAWLRQGAALARRASASPRSPVLAAGTLAGLALIQALWAALNTHGRLVHAGDLVACVLLAGVSLVATIPLGLGWTQPSAAAVTICAANLVSLAAFHLLTLGGLAAQLIAAYWLGRRGPQWLAAALALPFLILALVLVTGRPALGSPPWPAPGEVVLAVLAASLAPVTACAGAASQARRLVRQQTEVRAEIAGTLLEHTARGERARISRELHDVVAHHISMIAVQAETARLATPGMPAAGAERLSAIGDTARAALTEMRRLLGVLREDTRGPEPDLAPQPGLAQLNELLDEAREASGSGARLIVSGWLTSLDPGVELAAYRIIQEALTNARRHAPGAAVDVELRFTPDALHLRVRDNGPGPAPAGAQREGAGHGLLGMRERAAAVGGQLSAGPAPGLGFQVEATLPAKAEEYVA
jgi:signal transduction histidine kinase